MRIFLKNFLVGQFHYTDNKYAALNTAAWSGGSFVYVPKGVKVTSSPASVFLHSNSKLGAIRKNFDNCR
ncbi:MAG: hypothetical protein KatS3mg086_011 [Candidatus Dojkabacteria bacterium]|nr:MAG: hypothetical protein KatS3mg086_011 [Candidatus Dojkabacteria bacterium]